MKKDYSQLPEEIVEKIATEHLDTFAQVVAFSGVCTSWRSAALELYNRRRHNVPSLPGILVSKESFNRLPYRYLDHRHKGTNPAPEIRRQFLPISTIFRGVDYVVTPPRRRFRPNFLTRRRNEEEGEVEKKLGLRSIPNSTTGVDLQNCDVIASRDGWLVVVHYPRRKPPLEMYIVNPITGASISLPPLLHVDSNSRILLSSSPHYNDDDCYVIVVTNLIYHRPTQVSWYKVRSGGRRWKFIRKDSRFFDRVKCAAYFGGKLYVLDNENYVHVFHNLIINTTSHPNPTVRSFQFSPEMQSSPYGAGRTFYHLLELKGEPIVVLCHCYGDLVTVKVYKLLEGSSSSCCWEEVKSLEGYALFLATHHSFCVDENEIAKSNHIYYLYNDDSGGSVYHLEEQKVVQNFGFFPLEVDYNRVRVQDYYELCVRDWFTPMPWDIRKHLKKQKDKVWKRDRMQPEASHSSDFKLSSPVKETIIHKPSLNRFQALSLTDDDEDNDDE